MAEDFRKYGFTTTHTEEDLDAMKRAFHRSPSRRRKTGTYVGLTELEKMVRSLREGGFDGLQICYGINKATGEALGTYELILKEVKLVMNGNDIDTVKEGILYCSVAEDSTEPPGLSCPPLKCR